MAHRADCQARPPSLERLVHPGFDCRPGAGCLGLRPGQRGSCDGLDGAGVGAARCRIAHDPGLCADCGGLCASQPHQGCAWPSDAGRRAGVQAWALGHLLANGTLAAVVLFGAFLAWAVADFVSARRRDREAGTSYPAGTPARDAMVAVVGLAGWVLFGFVLHEWMTGVRAFG
ncbi:hypothetical membrane spanning protein [Cupriavidus necator H16]|uniref:Hypothetical membrane spanning protein n=1 Tax=Cupriavidus necator (strain ATCC 17699 / DSM 428 / KCTC 22496 / NCIMB 10442 / H16 / Stanier 337) TaxID=381666 RepID=Q0K180_CUPNH|nr:hypothetical membrane spanning protein [Cupriavidus necator H16]